MKILVDLTVLELPATGIARVVTGLYQSIALGFRGMELHGVHRRKLVASPPEGVSTRRVGRVLTAELWRRYALPLAARRAGGAIIHFPWNGGVPKLPSTTRVVTTLHDVLPLTIPGYFASVEEETLYRMHRQTDIDRSTLVVTDSEYSKHEIVRHFRVTREPVVIPCATTIAGLSPEPFVAEKEYFLYVGGLDPRKAVDDLLRVFSTLSQEGALRGKLVVAGSVRYAPPPLVALLKKSVDQGCVTVSGYVDDPTLAGLYAGAIALVYPSPYEGFGLPPLEAMAIGCPVITRRETSIPEVCGDAAYYVDPWSDTGLAEALRVFERDGDLRARLGAAGKIRARAFSWERSADAFVGGLRNCISDLE